MIKIFLPWDSVSVYWFLYSLFIARLTYFLCGKQRLVSVFLLFFAVSALPLKEYIGGYIDEQIFNAIDRICLAGTFVGFGLIAASYDNVGAFLHARWSGLVFGFCWASLVVVLAQLGVFGTAAHLASDAWTTSVVWAVCAFSGAVFWFSVARQFEDKFKLRLGLLVDIGRASIAIYVMHIFFIVAMRTLLLKLGFRDATLHLVAETMVGIFIPMAAFFLANWLRIAPYVGFGKNMRPARVAVQKDEKATAGSN
jgi:fucose 4-O-acetylase-like acetyltransferase